MALSRGLSYVKSHGRAFQESVLNMARWNRKASVAETQEAGRRKK